MKRITLILATLTLLLGIGFSSSKIQAARTGATKTTDTRTTLVDYTDYNKLYRDAISAGVINPKTLSYDAWVKENVKEFLPVYKNALAQKAFDGSFTYEDWLKANNYGQAPVGSKTITPRSTVGGVTQESIVGGFTLKAGDIFITNSTEDGSSGVYLGHAAIANGDGHILDMPGPGQHNRQSTMADWINEYSKPGKWIKVYRLNNSTLAAQVAKYADTHFYSSNGTATQDIFLDYQITIHAYEINPTYCSKLVYDALWYGSGSTDLMMTCSGIVTPFELPNLIMGAYGPNLVKTYNG
jgi:hypothetical protein